MKPWVDRYMRQLLSVNCNEAHEGFMMKHQHISGMRASVILIQSAELSEISMAAFTQASAGKL
jgi:hypothetical protein